MVKKELLEKANKTQLQIQATALFNSLSTAGAQYKQVCGKEFEPAYPDVQTTLRIFTAAKKVCMVLAGAHCVQVLKGSVQVVEAKALVPILDALPALAN